MNMHTPGPWTQHESMRDCVTFKGRHGTENLFLQNLDGYFACQNEEDARLIAAAPTMLAVLQELQESASYWGEYDVPLGIVERINAAIDLATKGQP